ncbi:Capsular polysaccharide type 8 biosynthesis protein cap8A [compost metagenome]
MIVANAETMGTLRVMFREPIVMEKIAQELKLNRSAAQLRSQIRVESVEGSLITVVTAIDSNPKLAADIANTGVSAYKQVAAETLGISSIRVLSEAQENRNSINEKSYTLVYAAFIAGLVLGIGLSFVLDSLDDSVRSKRDIEELLGLTMLGQVSRMTRKDYAKKSRKHKSIVARGETIGS